MMETSPDMQLFIKRVWEAAELGRSMKDQELKDAVIFWKIVTNHLLSIVNETGTFSLHNPKLSRSSDPLIVVEAPVIKDASGVVIDFTGLPNIIENNMLVEPTESVQDAVPSQPSDIEQPWKAYSTIETELSFETYTCARCKAIFMTAQELTDHQNQHAKDLFECNDCQRQFTSAGTLDRHRKSQICRKSLDCPRCDASFNTKFRLLRHQNQHDGLNRFKCTICVKGFSSVPELLKHMMGHREAGNFSCPFCKKTFKRRSFAMTHIEKHTTVHTFQCKICPDNFLKKEDFDSHSLTHGASKRQFMCGTCNKKFTRRETLEAHLYQHEGKQTYICKHCDLSFSDPSALNKHMKTLKNTLKSKSSKATKKIKSTKRCIKPKIIPIDKGSVNIEMSTDINTNKVNGDVVDVEVNGDVVDVDVNVDVGDVEVNGDVVDVAVKVDVGDVDFNVVDDITNDVILDFNVNTQCDKEPFDIALEDLNDVLNLDYEAFSLYNFEESFDYGTLLETFE